MGFWFPTTTAVRLAICRVLLVSAWILFFAFPFDEIAIPLIYDPARIDQALIRAILTVVPVEVFHTERVLRGIWLITTASGVLAAVGLFTRTSLLTFGLGNCVLIAHMYSYGELHHPRAIYCIALVLMALAPSGRCYSLDSWLARRSGDSDRWGPDATMDTATWPLRLVQCLLGLAYFSAGSAKLLYGGLQWMNGATLQTIVLSDYVRFGMPAGAWLMQSFWLCVAGSVVTIVVETFFFIAVFVRGARKYVLSAGVALHVGIYLTMAAPFFTWMILYLTFVDFEALRSRFVSGGDGRSGAEGPAPGEANSVATARRTAPLLLLAVLAATGSQVACRSNAVAPPEVVAALQLDRRRVPLGGPVEMTYSFAPLPRFDSAAVPYRVSVRFLHPEGQVLFTDDHDPPVPTTQWRPGETVTYTRRFFVPLYPYVGAASIALGLYSPGTGDRVMLSGSGVSEAGAVVASIRLDPPPKSTPGLGRGWYPPESFADRSWRWSMEEATLEFHNPGRTARLYLELAGRPDAQRSPQRVDLSIGGRAIGRIVVDDPRPTFHTVVIGATDFGGDRTVELTLRIDGTFVPSELPDVESDDDRRLGVRLFNTFLEPDPALGDSRGAGLPGPGGWRPDQPVTPLPTDLP